MGLLDPGLNFFLQQQTPAQLLFNTAEALMELNPSPAEPDLKVIVHFDSSLEAAEQAGFKPSAVAGGVASGFASKADLESIAVAAGVVLVEGSRPLVDELDRSIKEIRADVVHAASPPCRGAGVIVGIIEFDIDYTHKCFLDQSGNTRILALWDQNLTPEADEAPPTDFKYGVEYTGEMINAALALGSNAFDKVRHIAHRNHGTLVAGIAAGNGSVAGVAMGNGGRVAEQMPAGTYVGVAPEADIMVVAYNTDGPMGESGYLIDAIKYLLDKAGARPIVINISQGDYLGPHDGMSGVERYIDGVLGKPGQIIVKSAGNACGQSTHASGTIHTGQSITLNLKVPDNDAEQDVIDIWYSGDDRIGIAIKPPQHAPSNNISDGSAKVMLTLPNKNQVYIESITRYPLNGDNRIYVRLLPGDLNLIEPGDWELILTGLEVNNGSFNAWIDTSKQYPEPVPKFVSPYENDLCTISIPGTASKIITVGSFVTHIFVPHANAEEEAQIKGLMGTLAPNSSLGPTRDGRTKPEITAPGEAIISALKGKNDEEQYFMSGGTSMSAPHVTGAIALLLEKKPTLTQAEVKDIICRYASTDAHTNSPSEGWGAGKLDVLACHQSVI